MTVDLQQVRRTGELLFPGFAMGVLSGCIAGVIAWVGGLPGDYVLVMTLSLAVPLAIFGMGYNALLARGRVRLGGVAPAALYWVIAFPLARLVNETVNDMFVGGSVQFADGLGPFLLYQAMLSLGFAVGFIWMHEYVFSYWWLWIRGHNPVADHYVLQYQSQAVRTHGDKQRRGKPGNNRRPRNPAVRA